MEFSKQTLPNGLRILTVPMPHLESVTVMIGVGAGSRYEEKEKQGIAHFTEHMAFKGTKRRPTALAISSELDSLGAHFNAATGEEETVFYAKASANQLSKLMEILTDLMLHSQFSPQEIEREKKVILEELRMYRDNPRRWVERLAAQVTFGEHPLGREGIGTEETISKIAREDFHTFQNLWYLPQNMVVAAAGKIEEEEVLGEVKRWLGEQIGEDLGVPLGYTFLQRAPQALLGKRKTDQTHFVVSLPAYPLTHPNREKLDVLTTFLGGGMSSRLFTEVREKRGLAYYVHAGWSGFFDTGFFEVHAGVNNRRFEEALSVVVGELRKLKEEKVSQEELQKAKEMIRGDLALGIESTDGACSYFLMQELLEKKIETPQEKMAKIEVITSEDIQRVAQDLFTSERLNLAVIGPFSEKDRRRFLSLLSL